MKWGDRIMKAMAEAICRCSYEGMTPEEERLAETGLEAEVCPPLAPF